MPFAATYTRSKNFAALGSLFPGDLNTIQDDIGNHIVKVAPIVTVSALPGSPSDGQVVYYQSAAMAAVSVIWAFRYRAASADAKKWEFIGGAPLYAEVNTTETTASTTYTDVATVGPSITAPLLGVYECEYGAQMSTAAISGNTAFAGLDVNGAGAADTYSALISTAAAVSATGSVMRKSQHTINAGAVAKLTYRSSSASAGTISAARRWLAIRPLRVQ